MLLVFIYFLQLAIAYSTKVSGLFFFFKKKSKDNCFCWKGTWRALNPCISLSKIVKCEIKWPLGWGRKSMSVVGTGKVNCAPPSLPVEYHRLPLAGCMGQSCTCPFHRMLAIVMYGAPFIIGVRAALS